MPGPAALPNLLSGLRLLLVPVLWWATFAGDGRPAGIVLIVAGASDYLDGLLARRLGVASPSGSRLDSAADVAVLFSVALCLIHLHPEIATENSGLLAATVFVYGAALAMGIGRYGRIPNFHLYSGRLAGGCLYAFALLTLFTGDYWPLLLAAAAGGLLVSSLETLAVQAIIASPDLNVGSVLRLWSAARSNLMDMTITNAIATTRKQRSHTPHISNGVASKNSAAVSSATSVTPMIVERRT